MGKIRRKMERAGLALVSLIFHIIFYVCVAVLVFWLGKQSYQFGYQVFNQQAISPGEGEMVTVVIPQGASDYQIGQVLKVNGLVSDARVFYVQEILSNYRGKLNPGIYTLSTAYTPTRIMGVLAGEEEEEDKKG
ncbi:MAG: solute-binding protein [Blautia sp.]|nr:solute-binding protein [Blautia sp.]